MREAHTLKGAAGTVCAPLLHKLAAALEARLRAGVPVEPGDLPGLGRALDAFIEAVEGSGVVAQVAV
jgi:HPt (histidine-containing phosphotransfer) domain-containing protein